MFGNVFFYTLVSLMYTYNKKFIATTKSSTFILQRNCSQRFQLCECVVRSQVFLRFVTKTPTTRTGVDGIQKYFVLNRIEWWRRIQFITLMKTNKNSWAIFMCLIFRDKLWYRHFKKKIISFTRIAMIRFMFHKSLWPEWQS